MMPRTVYVVVGGGAGIRHLVRAFATYEEAEKWAGYCEQGAREAAAMWAHAGGRPRSDTQTAIDVATRFNVEPVELYGEGEE